MSIKPTRSVSAVMLLSVASVLFSSKPATVQHVNLYVEANRVPKLTQFISLSRLERYDMPTCRAQIYKNKADPHLAQHMNELSKEAEIDCLEYEIDRLRIMVRDLQRGIVNYAFAVEEVVFDTAPEKPEEAAKSAPLLPPEVVEEGPIPLPSQNPLSEGRPQWARP